MTYISGISETVAVSVSGERTRIKQQQKIEKDWAPVLANMAATKRLLKFVPNRGNSFNRCSTVEVIRSKLSFPMLSSAMQLFSWHKMEVEVQEDEL